MTRSNHLPMPSPSDRIGDDRLREILTGCEGVQGGPWQLDKFACYVWAPSEKGGDFPVMDEPGQNGRVVELRGWGYYTGHGHGALGLPAEEAKRRQRLTGEHVARLDPQTVSSIVSELLSHRERLAYRHDELVEAVSRPNKEPSNGK